MAILASHLNMCKEYANYVNYNNDYNRNWPLDLEFMYVCGCYTSLAFL